MGSTGESDSILSGVIRETLKHRLQWGVRDEATNQVINVISLEKAQAHLKLVPGAEILVRSVSEWIPVAGLGG